MSARAESLAAATREAAGAALEETSADTTASAEGAEEQETSASDASTSEAEPAVESESTETESEAPEGTEEVPESYFGIDLSGVPAEQRAEVIDGLRKRDDHIGKLLRERSSEESGETEKSVETETPAELTDEAILQALGLDPESPLDEQAVKVALPLVRKQVAQDKAISQLIEIAELGELDRTWRSSLSAMEKEFGALPTEVTHDRVMEYAAEQGISNPMDAYWRIVGPGRQVLSEAVTKAKDAALTKAKKAAAGTRPDSSEAEDEIPVEGTTTKEATKNAVSKVLAGLGIGTDT